MGIIKDAENPISRQARQGAAMLVEILWNLDVNTEVAGFTRVDKTLIDGGPSDAQPFDITGTSSATTPLQTAAPYPSTSRSVPTCYVVITQVIWNEMMKRLRTMETKVWLMEMGVKSWVKKIIKEQSRVI